MLCGKPAVKLFYDVLLAEGNIREGHHYCEEHQVDNVPTNGLYKGTETCEYVLAETRQ